MNTQQAGYYNATPVDYGMATLVGVLASTVAGGIAAALGGLWFFAIFYAPAAGGVIAEAIRRSIQKRRGRYVWLVACVTVLIGAFIGSSAFVVIGSVGRSGRLELLLAAILARILSSAFNIGLWIYLVLAVGTVYARLRN